MAAVVAAISAALAAQPVPVIVIGVDGLSVDAVRRAGMPNLRTMMKRAAWSLTARGVMPTLSSPNWESMITGAGTEQHGITSNGWFRRLVEFQPVCQGPDGRYPTIFDALRRARPDAGIAIFHDWGGFAKLVPKGAADVMRHERGAAATTSAAVRYWTEHHPALLFVHLDNVDHAGHAGGWGSQAYLRAAADADGHIGKLLAMLADESSAYVLVTSDHGGTPRGHGKNSLDEIQIPWILTGPGVEPGPVAGQVNTFDTAATLAWIFGLKPLSCAIGRPVVAAFRPAARPLEASGTNAPGCVPVDGNGNPIRPLIRAARSNN